MLKPLVSLLPTTILVFSLTACTSEPPPVPPAELLSTSNEQSLVRLWSAKIGEAGRGRFELDLKGDNLVLANRKGQVSKLSAATGMRQWQRDLDVRLTAGVGGTENVAIVTDVNAMVHVLDRDSGNTLWQATMSSEVIRPVSAGFGLAVVRSNDGRVVAFDLADGSERWRVSNTPPALTLNGYSRPLLLNGGVLVGLDDGRVLALNQSTGKLIWESVLSVPSGRSEVERLVDVDADLLIDDTAIYAANYQGKVVRLEPAQGQTIWSVPLSAGSGMAQDLTRLVVVDEKDTVHMLAKESGQALWQNNTMPGRRLSPPALTPDGDVLVGDVEGFLHILSGDDGRAVGRSRLGDEPILAAPVIVDDVAYLLSSSGQVAAYRFTR